MSSFKKHFQIFQGVIVLILGLEISLGIRCIILDRGGDKYTANSAVQFIFPFFIVLSFFIFMNSARPIIPYLMERSSVFKKLILTLRPSYSINHENKVSDHEDTTSNDKETVINQIREDSERRYIEKQNAKINAFLKYSHLTMAPHLTNGELLQLDEYIKCFIREENLPDDLITIKTGELKNHDLFHFGWNMANYFERQKQDVVPWLQQVFADLQELEYSYIKGKLHDPQTEKYRFLISKTSLHF